MKREILVEVLTKRKTVTANDKLILPYSLSEVSAALGFQRALDPKAQVKGSPLETASVGDVFPVKVTEESPWGALVLMWA